MTEAATSAVAIGALRKSFGATLAVDDVNFTIKQGISHLGAAYGHIVNILLRYLFHLEIIKRCKLGKFCKAAFPVSAEMMVVANH